jgi:CYTH domain-containing protein
MLKEDSYIEYARRMKNNDKVLLVCDRGICDNRAYMTQEQFDMLLQRIGITKQDAFSRYDAVFHLVTAADGAEKFYTLGNNKVRKEGIAEAIVLDQQTQNAWVGHPHLRIIKNDGTFDDKLRKLMSEISRLLGEPNPYEIERKFLIERPDPEMLLAMPNCQKVQILQTYLRSEPGHEVRIRQRGTSSGENTSYIFTKTDKINTNDPAKRIEIEKRITQDEYLRLLMDADPELHYVAKDRYCIMQRDSGQYIEIDVYPGNRKHAILEIELSSPDEQLVIPSYVHVIREVTNDLKYRNRAIAGNGGKLP